MSCSQAGKVIYGLATVIPLQRIALVFVVEFTIAEQDISAGCTVGIHQLILFHN